MGIVGITLCYIQYTTTGGIVSAYSEAKLSWDRGLTTDSYEAFKAADRGIQAIPSLILILSGLPFFWTNPIKTCGGLGSVGMSIALCVPFIYEQFDLGLVTRIRNLEDNLSETSELDGDSAASCSP